LTEVPALAKELGVGRVFVKDESYRFGLSAFKALGASWAIANLLLERSGGAETADLSELRSFAARNPIEFVAATDGNHGRAVAWMATLVGLRAHIFVPVVTSPKMISAIAAEGAKVTAVSGSYDEAVELAAAEVSANSSAVLVQDTAWPGYINVPTRIVEGYTTLFDEIDLQMEGINTTSSSLIAVPVGVGSLAQAAVTHYRSKNDSRNVSILSVEADSAACLLSSLISGDQISVPTDVTNMAGLNCGTVSSLAWPYLQGGIDAAISVSDILAAQAVLDLAECGISSGPSGASSLAGARSALCGKGSRRRREEIDINQNSVVVLLSTEGNSGLVS
jgi:diaminopropionate ammonia-lyase